MQMSMWGNTVFAFRLVYKMRALKRKSFVADFCLGFGIGLAAAGVILLIFMAMM